MATELHENLNKLRLENTACDLILQIGTKSFLAHRAVLIAQIEYFRNMFTTDMKERKELVIPLDPEIVDSTFFEKILTYVYISKIDFTDENIRPICRAADYFCFDKLTSEVIEHMKSNLTVENVVFYKTVAIEFGLETLENDCHQFIIQNLSSDIQREQLIPILLLEDLNEILQKLKQTGKLEEMFYYSIHWMVYNKDNSAEKLSELLENIPLESLSFNFLKQVVSQNDLIRKDIKCSNLFFDAFITVSDLHERGVEEKNQLQVEKLNSAIRESDSKLQEAIKVYNEKLNSRLYAIGGMNGETFSSVSEYSNITRQWTATTPMPGLKTHVGCAVIEHKIYVCGGHDGNRNVKDLLVFDTLTRTWTQLAPMKHKRQLPGVAALNGQIYVAGGYHNHDDGTEWKALSVVERYCVKTNQWSDIAPMSTLKNAPELVALNGFLYAIGGHNCTCALNSVERYDPRTGQWTQMNNTNHRYYAFGSAVLNGYIYILGEEKFEVYYEAEDRWTEMPAPSLCGLGRRLAVYNGKLFAIGGSVGEPISHGRSNVETFDMQARVWRPEPDIDVARCFHGVAVVEN